MINLSAPLQGMQSAMAQFQSAAGKIAQAPAVGLDQPTDAIDLSAEMVALLQAKNQFESNVKAAHVGDEMMKSSRGVAVDLRHVKKL